jgi:hypothetical protein
MQDDVDPVTIDEACAIIGGKTRPINRATYYRGVKAGRYPAPFKPSPNISRVDGNKVRAARRKLASDAPEAA